jgi:hypothetical protein
MLILESQDNTTATENLSNQLQKLQRAGVFSNNKSLFLKVIFSSVSQPIHDFPQKIYEGLWHSYAITAVILVIPYFRTAKTYVGNLTGVQETSTATGIYTWCTFSSKGICGNVGSAEVIDKWLVENSESFLQNGKLSRNQTAGYLMGCTVKVSKRVFPPFIVELPQGSVNKYGGFEVDILRCILEKLNLSAEYKVLVPTNTLQSEIAAKLINEIVSGDTDISIGGLAANDDFASRADFTVPYGKNVIKWYFPCAKHAHPWTAMTRVYTLDAWIFVLCAAFPLVAITHRIAVCANKYQLRESHQYMNFESCLYICISITLGVSVTELPRTSVLRTFVFLYILFSFMMTTMFQSYFTSFLLNPVLEKDFSTIKDILESGIQYGYSSDVEEILKHDSEESEYETMQGRRIMFEDQCQCFERMLKERNFACVSNTFCAEVLMMSLVSSDSRRDVCMLPDEVDRRHTVMYLKRGHPLLSHFNSIIRRVMEAGLVSKWTHDFISKQKFKYVSPPLSRAKDIEGSTNAEADNSYTAGYFAFSVQHLQVAFHILLLGHLLSSFALIAEVTYRSLCGQTTNTSL